MTNTSNLAPRLPAHLFIALILLFASATGIRAAQAGDSPIKIIIMAGQSNMQGQGEISPITTQGTLEYIVANDPGGDYQFLGSGVGSWVERDDVWITDEDANRGKLTVGYGVDGTTVGPELGFGHFAGDLYEKQVLIVKAAWGGKSLGVDFRPPSSGGVTGPYYTDTLNLVNDAIANLALYFPDYDGLGYEIAGFCWHQGWNDRVNSGRSAEYEFNMANFIRDIRTDLGVPDLPFVIATTGMDGTSYPSEVEYAQLAMTNTAIYPDFAGNVAVIDTRNGYGELEFWKSAAQSPSGQGYHWNRNAMTYVNIGLAMGDAMSTLSLARCPSRLRATGGPGGVTLTWLNGHEIPTSVRVLRDSVGDSVELSASAPTTPATFLDAAAVPGVYDYELDFTMPGDPCAPLTLTFNSGITDLGSRRGPNGSVVLNWTNNLGYDAIEVRRNGMVIEALLSGSATIYTDTSPPWGGPHTYSVVPTNGSSAPATVQIDLAGPPSGTAVVYEPFDYDVGSLQGKGGTTEVGLTGTWAPVGHNDPVGVVAPVLGWNTLAVSGNSEKYGSNFGYSARAIAPGALDGLLDDGDTLWFSLIVVAGNAGQQRNFFSIGSDGFQNADYGAWGGLGRVPNGVISQENGLGFKTETGGPLTAIANLPGNIGADGWDDYSLGTGSYDTAPTNTQGELALVVGKVTFGTGGADDVLEIHVPDDMSTLGPVRSTISANCDQAQWDTISLAQKSSSGVDEIRIGATLADVMPAQTEDIPIKILSISSNETEVTLEFKGAANSAYKLTESIDLDSGFSDTEPLVETTTDASGNGTLIWPISGTKGFARVETK